MYYYKDFFEAPLKDKKKADTEIAKFSVRFHDEVRIKKIGRHGRGLPVNPIPKQSTRNKLMSRISQSESRSDEIGFDEMGEHHSQMSEDSLDGALAAMKPNRRIYAASETVNSGYSSSSDEDELNGEGESGNEGNSDEQEDQPSIMSRFKQDLFADNEGSVDEDKQGVSSFPEW